jgi:hypothetical protein
MVNRVTTNYMGVYNTLHYDLNDSIHKNTSVTSYFEIFYKVLCVNQDIINGPIKDVIQTKAFNDLVW